MIMVLFIFKYAKYFILMNKRLKKLTFTVPNSFVSHLSIQSIKV